MVEPCGTSVLYGTALLMCTVCVCVCVCTVDWLSGACLGFLGLPLLATTRIHQITHQIKENEKASQRRQQKKQTQHKTDPALLRPTTRFWEGFRTSNAHSALRFTGRAARVTDSLLSATPSTQSRQLSLLTLLKLSARARERGFGGSMAAGFVFFCLAKKLKRKEVVLRGATKLEP